jgi:hypothetical protein
MENMESESEFVESILNNDKEYVFTYVNNDKRYMTENSYIEYYEKGNEFEVIEPIGISGIATESGMVKYILKLEKENTIIGCYIDGNGSGVPMSIPYYKRYKKYEVINKDKVKIINNKEIILGAVMFSTSEGIKFDYKKLLNPSIEDRKIEYSKFDFGFIFKLKLTHISYNIYFQTSMQSYN